MLCTLFSGSSIPDITRRPAHRDRLTAALPQSRSRRRALPPHSGAVGAGAGARTGGSGFVTLAEQTQGARGEHVRAFPRPSRGEPVALVTSSLTSSGFKG